MKSVIATCFLFAFVVPSYSAVLPSDIQTCKKSNPNFNDCIIALVESLRHRLKAGIPEINVPPYDPLFLPKLKIDRERPELKIKATARNVNVVGPSLFQIQNLKIDVNKYTADIKIKLPALYITCNYDVKGSRLLLLPLDGKGFLKANITNLVVRAKGSAKEIQKDGKTFLQVDRVAAKARIGGMLVHFEESSRPLAAQTTELFINNNQRQVLDIITPIAEEVAPSIATPIINDILGSIPLAELLPDD